MISSNFSFVFEYRSAILNFENLMTDLDSATPKTCIRPISSSSEHFSKFWPPYWIRHFEFWKSDTSFGFSDPKNLCTATLTNIRWKLSETSTHLYFFKIFKWKITILKMITTFLMKNKSIPSNYTIFEHRWLKKVWSFLAISMWRNSCKHFFPKLFMFFDIKAAIFNLIEEVFQFRAQILKEHTRK